MDVSNPSVQKEIAEKEIVGLIVGHPILLLNNRMVVMETYDGNRIGCNFFDISNKTIKRLQKGLFKNHCIRAYHQTENCLYIVHLDFKKTDNERKYKTYLSTITTTENIGVEFTKELPFIEIYGDDSSKILWLVKSNTKIIILLANGNFYTITI